MRTELTPDDLPGRAFYRLLTSVVVPRPIAWISTTSASGVDNLAPHSFFTIASTAPAIVQFSSSGHKDTLRNVEETGEFVVNLAPQELQRQVNESAVDFPPDISEFDAVGIKREASRAVRPPRVAASPVALECRLHSTVALGGTTVVFGEVVHAAVADSAMVDGHPDVALLHPLSRLGRNEWATVGEVSRVDRISYTDWPDGAR
ncbi:flavin reductase family protein [Nocardiopsis ansamitocini]|uniref:Flavin reductase n=1 Tax=Nocardiopsis ansamitocini TaxID=1670832 RepID=A0A9W6UJF8_9ACTN|nr:flavin reductase family protein [Nocardiopsis ansamitocini]GLU48784.1 flavin reductase [Nocardiopsis ansamitocini]